MVSRVALYESHESRAKALAARQHPVLPLFLRDQHLTTVIPHKDQTWPDEWAEPIEKLLGKQADTWAAGVRVRSEGSTSSLFTVTISPCDRQEQALEPQVLTIVFRAMCECDPAHSTSTAFLSDQSCAICAKQERGQDCREIPVRLVHLHRSPPKHVPPPTRVREPTPVRLLMRILTFWRQPEAQAAMNTAVHVALVTTPCRQLPAESSRSLEAVT